EFSPAFELYGQVSYSRYEGQSFYQKTPSPSVGIQRDNAYLPDAFRALMVANNLTSVTIGTGNFAIPAQGSDNTRDVYRYVAGLKGAFDTGSIAWSYDAYY
ncbi:hypothetical protein OQ641_29285, partial [Klebsiella pneumoniae]|uniref:hypothetical protein n=1 Tax=Klebsiella pneumoniae TaxID=573 RepID=UPI002247A6E1